MKKNGPASSCHTTPPTKTNKKADALDWNKIIIQSHRSARFNATKEDKKMSGLIQSVVGFVRSLNLDEKLSPRKNQEIIWFYIFFPCLIVYLVFLSQYLNEKPSIGRIEVIDASLSKFVNPSSKIEIIASGLSWTEGPLWIQDENMPHLVFSDTVMNRIYKWEEGKGMFTIGKTVYVDQSGCKADKDYCEAMQEVGTNGLVRRNDENFDIIACSHGERAITLIRDNGTRSMVATHYKGSRLNSPNDLVWSPEGHIYFTDPNYGLYNKAQQIVGKELNHSGVYMIKADYLRLSLETGEPTVYVRLVESKLSHPNGLAFSPDFSKIYISNSDRGNTYINVYDVSDDGSFVNGRLFFDANQLYQKECEGSADQQCSANVGLVDGMKVDIHGNVFASGPGGVLILSPEGSLLGRLHLDRPVSNVAFGGDGRLYITAKDLVARLGVKTKPARILRKGKF